MDVLRQEILADSLPAAIWFWLVVLIGLIVVGAGAAMWLRRWSNTDDISGGEGFSLGDLRRLHREGKLTDQEYQTARNLLVGGIAGGERPDAVGQVKSKGAGPDNR